MSRSGPPRSCWRRDAAFTLAGLALLLAWDASGLDRAVAHAVGGGAQGFPWRDAWVTRSLLHDGGRWASALVLTGLVIGLLRRQGGGQGGATASPPVTWAALGMVLLNLLLVPGVKRSSSTSCPWDLAEFGGTARYVSHWDWGLSDGGVGRCFPAGHASAAFCFLPGYFWLRGQAPRAAGFWLAATLLAAFTIGLAQQVRGAHYFSHTLWTGWMCWVVTVVSYWLLEHKTWRRPVAAGR